MLINFKKIYFILIIIIGIIIYSPNSAIAQNKKDSTKVKDTTATGKKTSTAITSQVKYVAVDSIEVDMDEKKVRLYKTTQINYEEIIVTADYTEIQFNTSELTAKGLADTAGILRGKPEFKENENQFKSDEIRYNFNTRKGYIKKINTQEGEGYLHGNTVKKMPNDEINIRNGAYTTCNAAHPHFAIQFTKAKVIPKKKIITGPAYLSIEDVPTPIFIPFAFFPLNTGRASGILLPMPSKSQTQGYSLRNGGYYFGVNDYIDMEIRGDIYTNKSWATNITSKYVKLYKYTGNVYLSFTKNIWSEKELPDYKVSKDFQIKWSHTQSPKARPNTTFSANVNAGTSRYNRFNSFSTSDRLTNTMQSNISFAKNFANRFNFSANLRHSQNTLTRRVNLSLPEITFSMNRIYPFRTKHTTKIRGIHNISIGYVMNSQNQVNVIDTNLFKRTILDSLNNGVTHSIPIQSSLKFFKYLSITNSINFTERWYLTSIRRHWDDSLNMPVDTIIHGPETNRDFSYSLSASTKLYGMIQFKHMPVRAIRHIFTPSLTYMIRPDFSEAKWGFYESYIDGKGKEIKYSIFEKGIYGSPPSGKMGSLNFNISNNIEMKVRLLKDTVTGTKKIVLIENLSLNASYNLADVDLKWSTLSINGRTRLLKRLDLRYTSIWDPYVADSNGMRYPIYEYNTNNRLLRQINNNWAFGFNYMVEPEKIFGKNHSAYRVPWSLSFDYTFSYTDLLAPVFIWIPTYYHSMAYLEKQDKQQIIQTLGFNGSLTLTDKWRIGVRTGYDFELAKLSYTTVDITRDLHCWAMSFNWVPMGNYKSYTFTIRAKASMLQDLKYEKRKDPKDNLQLINK